MTEEPTKKRPPPLWGGRPTAKGSAMGGCARCNDVKRALADLDPSILMPGCDSCQPGIPPTSSEKKGEPNHD